MEGPIDIWEKPTARKSIWLPVGDNGLCGSVSSELPNYLIEHLKARHGLPFLSDNGFYLFQLPGSARTCCDPTSDKLSKKDTGWS